MLRAGALEMSSAVRDLDACFSALVSTHRDRALRLAWRLTGGDEAAAEDITQDAFLRAFRALGSFRGESSLETWFYRILVREAHNYRRWRGVREAWRSARSRERAEIVTPPAGDPALRKRIANALERLTRLQRQAFVLVHLEGFTVCETAKILRKAEGTVKSHLARALRALRNELADLEPRFATNRK
jgi:RNA polymerase sigma-70 factor (ECF subfamily)